MPRHRVVGTILASPSVANIKALFGKKYRKKLSSKNYEVKIFKYRVNYPPVTTVGEKLEVIVGMKVLAIGNIQDINLKFRAKFVLSLQWLDERHTYKNLKTGLLY